MYLAITRHLEKLELIFKIVQFLTGSRLFDTLGSGAISEPFTVHITGILNGYAQYFNTRQIYIITSKHVILHGPK